MLQRSAQLKTPRVSQPRNGSSPSPRGQKKVVKAPIVTSPPVRGLITRLPVLRDLTGTSQLNHTINSQLIPMIKALAGSRIIIVMRELEGNLGLHTFMHLHSIHKLCCADYFVKSIRFLEVLAEN
jgi:hypothetical protein